MKITSLKILDDYNNVKFSCEFDKLSLIWSKDNSYGKTTLIRFILYAFGFDVPSTKRIKLDKYWTELVIDNPSKKVVRNNNYFVVECLDCDCKKEFDLSTSSLNAHSFLFGLNNVRVIDNLLGTFYIDQEKGWTLLNRGKVISSRIGFNIEEFIIGLSNKDTSSFDARIDKLQEDIDRYSAIFNVVSLSEEQQQGYKEEEQLSDLKCIKSNLKSAIREKEKQRKEIKTIFDNNNKLIEIIESYRIMVRIPQSKEEVRVTKENIIDYGINQFMLGSQINEIDIEIEQLKKELAENDVLLQEYDGLINVDEASKQIMAQVKATNLNQTKLETLIESLKAEKRQLEEERNTLVSHDCLVENFLSEKIKSFAEKLKVFDRYVNKEKNYLKTRNLKEYTGALYHKVTLCYRLAYYSIVKEYLNLELPFIIDSPGSAEVKPEGMAEMLSLVKDVVKEQIIVSSIYENELGIPESKKIELTNGIFGDIGNNDD